MKKDSEKKESSRQLTLNRETIRVLEQRLLELARGGGGACPMTSLTGLDSGGC